MQLHSLQQFSRTANTRKLGGITNNGRRHHVIRIDFETYDILVVLEEALLQQGEVLPAKFPLKSQEMGVDPGLVLALDKYNSSSTLPHYIIYKQRNTAINCNQWPRG